MRCGADDCQGLEQLCRNIARPALAVMQATGLYGRRQLQVLADFFIGGHAAVEAWPLLTRNASRFRTYFPTLEVVAP